MGEGGFASKLGVAQAIEATSSQKVEGLERRLARTHNYRRTWHLFFKVQAVRAV